MGTLKPGGNTTDLESYISATRLTSLYVECRLYAARDRGIIVSQLFLNSHFLLFGLIIL